MMNYSKWSANLKANLYSNFICVVIFLMATSQLTYAQDRSTLALWDFNHSDRPAANAAWFNPVLANQGAAALSFTFSTGEDRPVTSFGGSDVDLDGFIAEENGGSFVPQGEKENGNYFQTSIDTRGYENLILSYATRGTSTGFQSQTWFTSIDNGEWSEITSYTGITSDYELRTIELTGFANIENLGIRCVVEGAASATGNNRFDNLRITGELETLELQLSNNTLSFSTPIGLDEVSGAEFFTISGFVTNAVLQISSTKFFELSEAANGTYANTLSIAPEDLVNDKQVFVRFAAPSSGTSGEIPGGISFNLDPSQSIALSAQLNGESYNIPYREDFDDPDLFLLPDWQRFQEVGEQTWTITNDNRTADSPYSARMNGFTSSPQENRNWLISPLLPTSDIAEDDFLVLKFESRSFFANGTPVLSVFASSNYDRTGDPTDQAFTWTELPAFLPLETGIWQSSGEINLSLFTETENLSFAIIYESTTESGGAAEWMVDNFEVYVTGDAPEPSIATNNWSLEDYHFGVIAPGMSADPRSMTLTAANLISPLTLNADNGIELSIDGNFSNELILNSDDFPESGILSVQTRMTASEDESVLAQAGSINISTEGLADTTFGYFNHTTINKDETFDVVTWNIEWFGDPANATTPSTNLQRTRVREMIEELDADVYAFQEITSIPAWNLLLLELDDYAGVLSPAFSRPAGDFDAAQKLAFLFKKSTVDTLQTKVLLDNLSSADLIDFPVANSGLFWASGRYPFAMDISATIGGIRRELTLVNVHGRSNGGGESASLPRYQLRKYDAEVLYDTLQAYYADKSVIILGDYNDDILRTVADTNEPTVPNSGESSFVKFIADTDNYLGVTLPLSEAGMRSFITQENVIDHVMINRNLFDDHIVGAERTVIPYSFIPDYNTTASDHLPVEARFLLSGESVVSALSDSKGATLLYPNPTNGVLYFKNFDAIQKVDLWTVTGQKLATFQGNVNQVDLSNFRSGIYLVRVISKSGQEIKRIILE